MKRNTCSLFDWCVENLVDAAEQANRAAWRADVLTNRTMWGEIQAWIELLNQMGHAAGAPFTEDDAYYIFSKITVDGEIMAEYGNPCGEVR